MDFGTFTASPNGMVAMNELDGVDMDLVIRPFTQKGVMTSLRQFTVNAMNQHQGMEAVERFGARFTGTDDFDGDGVKNEMTPGDISALVAWQATLPVPVQQVPDDKAGRRLPRPVRRRLRPSAVMLATRPACRFQVSHLRIPVLTMWQARSTPRRSKTRRL